MCYWRLVKLFMFSRRESTRTCENMGQRLSLSRCLCLSLLVCEPGNKQSFWLLGWGLGKMQTWKGTSLCKTQRQTALDRVDVGPWTVAKFPGLCWAGASSAAGKSELDSREPQATTEKHSVLVDECHCDTANKMNSCAKEQEGWGRLPPAMRLQHPP